MEEGSTQMREALERWMAYIHKGHQVNEPYVPDDPADIDILIKCGFSDTRAVVASPEIVKVMETRMTEMLSQFHYYINGDK